MQAFFDWVQAIVQALFHMITNFPVLGVIVAIIVILVLFGIGSFFAALNERLNTPREGESHADL